MTAKYFEGFAAVWLFLTCMWPIIRRQLFDNDFPPRFAHYFRFFLIAANVVFIGFAMAAIPGARRDPTIDPGFMIFSIAVFGALIVRHAYRLWRPDASTLAALKGEVIEIPEYANVHEVDGMTWIAIPDDPPEPSSMDAHLSEFDVRALRELIGYYSCSMGPFHPDFGRWMQNPSVDGRCLFDHIPGRWSELFWQSAANFLMSEGWTAISDDDDPEGYHSPIHTAGAVLVAIVAVYPDVADRVLREAAANEELAQFLADGYEEYEDFFDSRPVSAILDFVQSRKPPPRPE